MPDFDPRLVPASPPVYPDLEAPSLLVTPWEAAGGDPVEVRDYALDTEFRDDGHPVVVSLALVDVQHTGRELYLQNAAHDFRNDPDWLVRHVHTQLDAFDMGGRKRSCATRPDGSCHTHGTQCPWHEGARFEKRIRDFLRSTPKVRVWTWYGAYDWAGFCGLFGTLLDLPMNYPKFTMDLKVVVEWLESVYGVDIRLPELANKRQHHALDDARELAMRVRAVQKWARDLRAAPAYERFARSPLEKLMQSAAAGGTAEVGANG